MSAALGLGLDPEQFAQVFPFHVAFDEKLVVLQTGPALPKLCPGIGPGAQLTDHLRLRAQEGVLTYEALLASVSRLRVMETVAGQVPIRGQLLPCKSPACIVFLCSPWLTDPSSIRKLNLTISDFALHDPVVDLLHLVQSQAMALADAGRLAEKLTAQRAELRSVNAHLVAQYEVTRVLAQGTSIEELVPRILSLVRELGSWEIAVLWLLGDDASSSLTFAGGSSVGPSSGGVFEKYLHDNPPVPDVDPAGNAWREGLADWGADLVRLLRSGRARAAVKEGFRSACAFVLPGAHGVLGLCELYAREPRVRDARLLGALEEMGARMGQFIDKFRAEQQLRESKKAAEAATLAKSQFLARMSHEIRTPINGVIGMVDLVLGTPLAVRQREQLEMAQSSAELLLELVNDVLDFSKIEAGQLQLAETRFSLRECLDRPLQALGARARSKGLRFTVELPEELPEVVRGDPLRLSQVFINLLSNAVKFTHQGEVRLEARVLEVAGGRCLLGFSVSDTGIGIEPVKQRRIFEAFSQADAWTAQEYGGTGLGLSICHQLVRMMGGTISVESSANKGSCFRFTARLGLVESQRAQEPAAAVQPPPRVHRSLRVLVVEDNLVNQMVTRGLLELEGHQVETVDRGEAALARTRDAHFDLILMDIQMPELDGLEVTRRIREEEARGERARTPIVGLTAQAIAGDREKGLEAGMDEYLTKPVRGRQLAEVIERVVQRQEDVRRKAEERRQRARSSPACGAGRCVDRVSLEEQVGGDARLLLRVVGLFLQHGPAMCNAVFQAFTGGNAAALVAAAHKLKGALGDLSARCTFELCGRIEQLARQGNLPAARAEREKLEEQLGQVFQELKALEQELLISCSA